MSNIPMKRGEAKARWMIDRIDKAGLEILWTKDEGGKPSIAFPNAQSPEQLAVLTDAVLFAIGMPRCYATMMRLLAEREGGR